MPPKMKVPAPIDRPLARAYLREFTGWSTAYPPGVSDSTSLRIMENTLITESGACRIRPGLRYLSYTTVPTEAVPVGTAFNMPVVGSHEAFFLNDGTKAYLFAVRETDLTVSFRVLAETPSGRVVISLTDAGFSIPQGEAGESGINFRSTTQYVKYLQIDNKIFALSDAGSMLRMFNVGTTKTAKRMLPIVRPEWTVADKLTVVHPDAGWVNSGVPLTTRTNRVLNPSFETNDDTWTLDTTDTLISRDSTQHQAGGFSLRMSSLPQRTNLMTKPLHDVNSTGIGGWDASAGVDSITTTTGENAMRVNVHDGPAGFAGYVRGPDVNVKAGETYRVAFDVTSTNLIRATGVMVKFYNPADKQVGENLVVNDSLTNTVGRKLSSAFKVPSGALTLAVYLVGYHTSAQGDANYKVRNVSLFQSAESSTFFTGSTGTDYFWTGAVNASSSVYHPPVDVGIRQTMSLGAQRWAGSAYIRGTVARGAQLNLVYIGNNGVISNEVGTMTTDSTSGWTRLSNLGTAPANTTSVRLTIRVPALPRGEFHYVDSVLLEGGPTLGAYFDGSFGDSPSSKYEWNGTAHASSSTERTYSVGGTLPNPETRSPNTLISDGSNGHDNAYNFAFFYTFANEVGESAPSAITTVRCQRSWVQWKWETPNGAGEPSGNATSDPEQCADQLVCSMPSDVFVNAMASGAIKWNLYMLEWNDQSPVPVMAVRVDSRELKPTSALGPDGWLRVTPSQAEAGDEQMMVPTKNTRVNYSDPSRGGQGIVAADRMIIVKDATNPAVIKWTSNQQGSYTDFSASRGGGFKTLTSGNLNMAAVVKLWQNPQSADTLTILCRGVDGYNTCYYMAPAQIAQQSEAVNVMGFEETTATPGTTSPYGCEVFNNGLYHPLDDQLMKSTATMYNINHKSQTDKIDNMWQGLTRKEWIVSSVHDLRLYYLVHNPAGESLEPGCNGNEIWVLDGGASSDTGGGSWSRFLIQATSLRKIEQGGMIHMSISRPDGIYYLDELYGFDDFVDVDGSVKQRAIPWKIETNTQGANRAHDAWAHLQQVGINAGNFAGSMRYGIRSWDVNGRAVEVSKHVYDHNAPSELYYDFEDFLQIRRDLKEWFFFAESVPDKLGVTKPSYGQISLIQYRYAPISVNVGYEYGSVETFEYGRADYAGMNDTTDPYTTNGTPNPFIDTRRP